MASKKDNVLTEEFLAELYNCAIMKDDMCSIVCTHMVDEYLPDKDYQLLNSSLKKYYNEYKSAPKYGMIKQILSSSRGCSELLEEIRELSTDTSSDALREQFGNYLKIVRFKKAYKEIGKRFDSGDGLGAVRQFEQEGKELAQFSLAPEEFIDVAGTFNSRLLENKEKSVENASETPVNSFFIDQLDVMNDGRSLRTQLTVALAMSGVGKTHFARHIGYNAAYIKGERVLHIQLEGSKSECLNSYSAMLVKTNTVDFERGRISQHLLEQFQKQMSEYAGTLKVKAYSKFGKEITTTDVRNDCEEFKKLYGQYPDVLIVDSLDLLGDSSGKMWDNKSLRFKRIAAACDLKDLAAEINAWVFATYQATIENQDWVNDEKNVLNGYNLAEAKGLQRPCTHLVSLNQSEKEAKEGIVRMHVAKSRFFRANPRTFKICTDYEHEVFYDRMRTLNLPSEEQA